MESASQTYLCISLSPFLHPEEMRFLCLRLSQAG